MKENDPGQEGKPKKVTKKTTAKKTPVKKVTPKKKPAPKPLPIEEEPNQVYLNELLQRTVDQYKEIIDREIIDYREDIECLQNIATEYLDDFVIIGHTADEKRVIIRYAPTPRGYDALKDLSREYLMRMVMNDPLEGGEEGPF